MKGDEKPICSAQSVISHLVMTDDGKATTACYYRPYNRAKLKYATYLTVLKCRELKICLFSHIPIDVGGNHVICLDCFNKPHKTFTNIHLRDDSWYQLEVCEDLYV